MWCQQHTSERHDRITRASQRRPQVVPAKGCSIPAGQAAGACLFNCAGDLGQRDDKTASNRRRTRILIWNQRLGSEKHSQAPQSPVPGPAGCAGRLRRSSRAAACRCEAAVVRDSVCLPGGFCSQAQQRQSCWKRAAQRPSCAGGGSAASMPAPLPLQPQACAHAVHAAPLQTGSQPGGAQQALSAAVLSLSGA